VGYSLFRAGYHAPIDILGAALLTFLLALPALTYLPKGESCQGSEDTGGTLGLVIGGLGLVWMASGCLAFLFLDATLAGRMAALAAYGAGWRMVAGSALLVVGLGTLRLASPGRWLRFRRGVLLGSLLLIGTLTDVLIQRAWLHSHEPSAEAACEAERLRGVWLDHAEDKISATGNSMRWLVGGYIPKWEHLALLQHRIRAVDQDLKDFGLQPMGDREREAFLQLARHWSLLRVAMEKAAARVQRGELEGLETRERVAEELHRLQIQALASASELRRRFRTQAWSSRNWSGRPACNGVAQLRGANPGQGAAPAGAYSAA